MKNAFYCILLLAIAGFCSVGCRQTWVCQCVAVDSLGNITDARRYDYGNISYSSAQAKCTPTNHSLDTCYVLDHK